MYVYGVARVLCVCACELQGMSQMRAHVVTKPTDQSVSAAWRIQLKAPQRDFCGEEELHLRLLWVDWMVEKNIIYFHSRSLHGHLQKD